MDDPNMHAYVEDGPNDSEIGRQWREDSSLEKWFPITAERLAMLEQWARDCRDQVLYPAAQREDAIGRAAECLGQALAELRLGPSSGAEDDAAPETPAEPVAQEPDGTLHDDGCFTWKRGKAPPERNRVGWRADFWLQPTAAAIAAARAEGAEQMRDVLQRCVKGIDHLSELARLWEPDHSSGADRRGWVLAKDARDDAAELLRSLPVEAPNAKLSGPNGPQDRQR